jgi:hypothetical protein
MYGLYLLVVCSFAILVIKSVVSSTLAMSPKVPALEGQALGLKACLGQAESLWHRLDARRRTFSDADGGIALERDWERFRVEWLRSLRATESRCGTESGQRKKLARVFKALERVEDLYTTSAVQYSGEIAPAVAKFRKAIADERAE